MNRDFGYLHATVNYNSGKKLCINILLPYFTSTNLEMIHIASCKNGVGYNPWIHIDGWSKVVIVYVRSFEKSFV